MSEEKLPLSEYYKVIDHVTISKDQYWWSAVVLLEAKGRKSVVYYLWNNRGGKWTRKHKFMINRKKDWAPVKAAIESMLAKMEDGQAQPQE